MKWLSSTHGELKEKKKIPPRFDVQVTNWQQADRITDAYDGFHRSFVNFWDLSILSGSSSNSLRSCQVIGIEWKQCALEGAKQPKTDARMTGNILVTNR